MLLNSLRHSPARVPHLSRRYAPTGFGLRPQSIVLTLRGAARPSGSGSAHQAGSARKARPSLRSDVFPGGCRPTPPQAAVDPRRSVARVRKTRSEPNNGAQDEDRGVTAFASGNKRRRSLVTPTLSSPTQRDENDS